MSISALNPLVPGDLENAGGSAEEIRNLKSAIKDCFGGVAGPVKAGTAGALATDVQLTALFDRLTALEASIAGAGVFVQGMTMFWPYSVASIPAGWAQATGATVNGFTTRDMRGRMPLGADSVFVNPGDVGGSVAVINTSTQAAVALANTGSTALTAANIPNIAANLNITHNTGNDGINHNDSTTVAGGNLGSGGTGRPVVTATGLNGTGHTHTNPSVPAHSHTVTPTWPPYMGGCWITYVGVP